MIRALLAAVVRLLAALGWALWGKSLADARADMADATAEQAVAALARANDIIDIERDMARRMAGVAADHEREKRDAQDRAERLAADLLSGERRVRYEIAALHTARLSGAAATTRELDAAAQRGADLIATAVGVGARCDAVQRGLIRAYEVGQ